MYLQEEPSKPPINEPSRETDAHHTYRFQCNHEFTGLDVVAYLGKGSSNHSPGPMEALRTQADKSISIYDPGGLPIILIPKAQSPCKEYKCPVYPHLHSTIDQSYQNNLTASLLVTYFFASLMHMERHHC